MAENQLKLLQFTAKSFAGIDKNSPVIICFPQGYGGYVVARGDQATRKTSTLEAFKASCGLPMPDNAINRKDNDRRTVFEFEKGDKKYRVTITKTRFEVELLVDAEKLKWATLNSPKTMLGDLLGPIGLSPMFLKDYKGKAQIEWLKNFFRLDADALALEDEIEEKLTKTYTARRDAKRDLKKYEQQLEANEYYRNRQQWEQKLAAVKDEGTEEKIKDVQKRFNDYTKASNGVDALKTKKGQLNEAATRIDTEIEELHRQIQLKKDQKTGILKEVEELDTRLNTGEKYLEDNKGVLVENENIAATIREQEQMATHRANFAQMDEVTKTTNHLHQESIRLEGRLDELRKTKRELVKAFTPEIEGLEVCIPDEDDPREGLFYNGCPPLELSESELWGLYSQLLEKLDIKIILIENINALGSGAIELFDRFIQAGGYVIASEMQRNEKNMKVIVQNKIIEDLEEVEE